MLIFNTCKLSSLCFFRHAQKYSHESTVFISRNGRAFKNGRYIINTYQFDKRSILDMEVRFGRVLAHNSRSTFLGIETKLDSDIVSNYVCRVFKTHYVTDIDPKHTVQTNMDNTTLNDFLIRAIGRMG